VAAAKNIANFRKVPEIRGDSAHTYLEYGKSYEKSHLIGFGFRVQRLESTMQNLRRMGENSDPILSRLWTKVHEKFRRCRKPLVLSNAFCRLFLSRFFQKTFAIKSRSRRKTEEMQKLFCPQFLWEGRLRLFFSSLLGRLATPYLAKFA